MIETPGKPPKVTLLLVPRIWIPQLVATALLLWAFNPSNPYGYYIFLQWACCGVFVYLAFQAFAQKLHGWVCVLGITAGVYNPIIPVHLLPKADLAGAIFAVSRDRRLRLK